MDVTISFGEGASLDLPAWLQAGAAFVALGVTVYQWWTARGDARREKRARKMAGYAVLKNIHAALLHQAKRMERSAEGNVRPDMIGRFARSMLDGGFEMMDQSAQGIDIIGLPIAGVEAVMAGRAAVGGARRTLERLAENANAQAQSNARQVDRLENLTRERVETFAGSVADIEIAADLLLKAIEKG